MNDIHTEAAAAEQLHDFSLRDYSYVTNDFKGLIERFSNAVHVRDDVDGYLPLHLACTYGIDEVLPLLEAWLESVQIALFCGWLPLHIACHKRVPLSVIQFLVQVGPGTVCLQDNEGCHLQFGLHACN